MRAQSAEASSSRPYPLPRSCLGGLLNATPTRVREPEVRFIYYGHEEAPEPGFWSW